MWLSVQREVWNPQQDNCWERALPFIILEWCLAVLRTAKRRWVSGPCTAQLKPRPFKSEISTVMVCALSHQEIDGTGFHHFAS
jgi:hypothetical protein